VLGYILICILWGSTWLAIRMGLDSLTPIISAGIRFATASLFILLFMLIGKIKIQIDSLSIKLYLILALFSFVIPFGLVYWAEQFIPSGLASIIFATLPFGVLIFSRFAFPENKILINQLLGVIIGFSGIVIIFAEDISIDFANYTLGMMAVLLSATMQAGIAVTMKKYGKNLNPLSMNFIPLLLAGFIMVPLAFIFEERSKWSFDLKAVGSILYLAFFGTLVTFTTYYWLMKRISVVILSLTAFITPIIALILGWIILDEDFKLQTLIGSSLVLIGILFANFKGLLNYIQLKKGKVVA
jgi:drug/metabolite transporter (DMT)-like permease